MKIYFAGSIRGGVENASLFKEIVKYLRKYGDVIGGEHADETLASLQNNIDDKFIFDRDSKRLNEADLLVAEVTTPSLGVGYEIGRFVEQDKKILTLFNDSTGKKLSALINGSPLIVNKAYKNLEDIKKIIDKFFKTLDFDNQLD